MRRGLVLIALVAALLVMGRHPRFQGAAGRPIGRFADVCLDFDGDGVG